jgi:hypothetical protein
MNNFQSPFNLPVIGSGGVVHAGKFTGMTPAQQASLLQQEQQMLDMMSTPFDADLEQMFAQGGGIPERYKNMGFNKVGVKKQSDRPGKKWMVLAKKGDKYKVVHGGYKGMKDFTQHGSEKRKERFWDRMGGRDSAKANDPFSPLYWHKRFGTWKEGGEPQNPGFQALPAFVQAKIMSNMNFGGEWFNENSQDFYANGGGIDNPGFRALPPAVQQQIIENMKSGGENKPTNPGLWSRAKAAAKAKYDVYPSAYANGFAAKWYKERGGGWRKAEMGGCFECGGTMKYAEGGWIKEATDRMKAKGTVGSFTEQAKRAGFDSALAYAKHVKKNPDSVNETTRKRAQFVLNTSKAAYGMEIPNYQFAGQYLGDPFVGEMDTPIDLQPKALHQVWDFSKPLPPMQVQRSSPIEPMEAPQGPSWWDQNGALAVNFGLGALQNIAAGVEDRRQQKYFNNQRTADNVFSPTPQGMEDRGDYDVNTGQFRMDNQGFKNDARYWNPFVNVARPNPTYAQQGGTVAMVDDEILRELIAQGADIEILD